MHAEQRALEQKKSEPHRRGQTFVELSIALGISNSSLRRWARRGRIIGAHFIRNRWILLGKLTPKRIETIRSGLNLRQQHPKPPKKWKWRSKEERIALLDVEIARVDKAKEDLAFNDDLSSAGGLVRKQWRFLNEKLGTLELQRLTLVHGKSFVERNYGDDFSWLNNSKDFQSQQKKKLGSGWVRTRTRKKNA